VKKMKVVNKELHALKNGGMFVMLSVLGRRGEKLDLAAEGIQGKLDFFHELPKGPIDCSYLSDEHVIELGGATNETERSVYLVVGDSK
jgi:hypothetical protein